MIDDFPSNSHRDKEKPTPQPTQGHRSSKPKDIQQVTTGKAVQRKPPLGKRVRTFFMGEDPRSVIASATSEVLIPSLRDMVANFAIQTVEQAIFGDSRGRFRSSYRSPGGPSPTRYDAYASSSGGRSSAQWRPASDPRERRDISPMNRATHNFDDIVLESRGDAERTLDTLREIVSEYGSATLSDLYQLVGITSPYTDLKYGWTDLQGCSVQRLIGGGYLLNLPKPVPLD